MHKKTTFIIALTISLGASQHKNRSPKENNQIVRFNWLDSEDEDCYFDLKFMP